jgi:hypothetical protein
MSTSWDCCLGSRSGSHWEMHWNGAETARPTQAAMGQTGRDARDGTGRALTRGRAGCFLGASPSTGETQGELGELLGSPLGDDDGAHSAIPGRRAGRNTRGSRARAGKGWVTALGPALGEELQGQNWEKPEEDARTRTTLGENLVRHGPAASTRQH